VQLAGVIGEAERAAIRQQVQGVTPTRLLRELAEALEALASAHPLVLVLEDLHWSDASTAEALALLARRRETARLLVIGTYRPVELVLRAHPLKGVKQELQRHGQCAEVPLGYLNAAEVQSYLARRVPAPSATTAVATAVHQRTDGHPLFMVSMVDYLAQQGLLADSAEAEGARRLAAAAAQVPAGLQQLIETQLGQLRAEVQQVLDVASVAAGVPIAIDAIEAICEELSQQRQFIEDQGLVEWPDGTVSGHYRFRHAMYQEVLYRRGQWARRPAGRGVSAPG
jgi:predicted ATPase